MSVTTYPPTPPVRQSGGSNTLGMVAILLGMVDFVGQVISAAFSGQAYVAAVKSVGTTNFDDVGSEVDPHFNRMAVCFVVWIALWVLSLVPFILGIISVRRPPRAMGVTAITVSVLAPIIAFIIFCGFFFPVVNAYP